MLFRGKEALGRERDKTNRTQDVCFGCKEPSDIWKHISGQNILTKVQKFVLTATESKYYYLCLNG